MNISTFIKNNIPRALFLSLLCLAIPAGMVPSALDLNKYWTLRRAIPFTFYGDAFAGLNQVLAGEKYLGYYTDKDIQDPKYSAQFEQAQFSLAPLILELTDVSLLKSMGGRVDHPTQHRFILFDCRDEKECWRTLAEIKARPLKRNTLGAVLAQTMPK
jgi:hypothetical protein